MDLPLSEVKGIGPARLKALADAGITSVRELVMDLPREYRDLRESTPLCEAKAGESAAYRVQVAGDATEQRARRLLITRVYVTDGTETLMAVWYNQPWLKKQLPRGRELLLYGKAGDSPGGAAVGFAHHRNRRGDSARVQAHSRRAPEGVPAIGGTGAGGLRGPVAGRAAGGTEAKIRPVRAEFRHGAAPISRKVGRRWTRPGGASPLKNCCCIRWPCPCSAAAFEPACPWKFPRGRKRNIGRNCVSRPPGRKSGCFWKLGKICGLSGPWPGWCRETWAAAKRPLPSARCSWRCRPGRRRR